MTCPPFAAIPFGLAVAPPARGVRATLRATRVACGG